MAQRHKYHQRSESVFEQLWNAFWSPPSITCPKCKSEQTEYYDPFFFSPLRTLQGKRRMKCSMCHFIWRPSRSSRSLWDRLNNQ